MQKVIISIFLLLVISCGEDDNHSQECQTQNLNIDESNKRPPVNENNALFSLYPEQWNWEILSDDIIKTSYNFPTEDGLDDSVSLHLIFSTKNNCIDLLRSYQKTVYFDIDPNTFIEIIVDIIEIDYEINFTLQEYTPNIMVVGKNNTSKFWIEFNNDNHVN